MVGLDVAIPCYQYGRFLRECVLSVLNQGLPQVRVLIIDNASTDDSLEVARQLAAADPRVDVVSHATNLGAEVSFNEGVEWAASDYFMILCSDDLLAPGCLARAVLVLESRPDVSFAFGRDIEFLDGEGAPVIDPVAGQAQWRIISGDHFIEERCRRPARFVVSGSIVVRTSAQKRAGCYRPELPHSNDAEMLLRLALLGSVAETGTIQGIRRLHDSNKSRLYCKTRTQELGHRKAAFESFFANEGGLMPEAGRMRRLAKQGLAARAYWCGVRDFCCGKTASALDLFKFAFRAQPAVAVFPPVDYEGLSRLAVHLGLAKRRN
jgi:glycosyltransferase involved in cell wall biosynthesis